MPARKFLSAPTTRYMTSIVQIKPANLLPVCNAKHNECGILMGLNPVNSETTDMLFFLRVPEFSSQSRECYVISAADMHNYMQT